MIDKEKVIKGLECCTRYEVGKQLNNCLDCPYVEPIGFNQFRCKSQEMKEDALELLKEQECKPLRCKTCTMRDKTGFCHRWNIEVKEDDYCSFGAWKGC